MNEKYERQMKKGVLDMLVLKLLEEEDKYGYQLIQQLQERGGEAFALREGTLYPVLYRLEEEGLVESRWSEPGGKQVARKYYAVTEAGRDASRLLWQTWTRIACGVEGIMQEVSKED